MTGGGDRTGTLSYAPVASPEDMEQEIQRLRELVGVAESAIQTLRDRCEDADEAKAHLARLAVASARLHESADSAECLGNLQDVLLNLVGSEEIAVWSLSSDGRTLELRASRGIGPEPWQRVTVGEGAVGQAAESGDVVRPSQAAAGQPTVAIPLRLGRRVVGVVAVFRLLPHRSGLGPQDEDVFELVAQQAAFALCCSGEPWAAKGRDG
ncbi:MAG: GAF domain-containing protein [Deltaproteobacteria bacterium]|nr:GAF domain-containing protein [Deltaproteobacteria bacterium]